MIKNAKILKFMSEIGDLSAADIREKVYITFPEAKEDDRFICWLYFNWCCSEDPKGEDYQKPRPFDFTCLQNSLILVYEKLSKNETKM